MARALPIRLGDLLDPATQRALAAVFTGAARHGEGFFMADAAECRSRRVDLANPFDEDPGPLPLEQAPEGQKGVWLTFWEDPTGAKGSRAR